MKERLNYIDRLKGFAIILVVMGHLYFFSYGRSDSSVFSLISSFHMPLFMFLSGLVMSTPNFLKVLKQLKRFLLPMFIVGLLFTLSFQSSIAISTIPKVIVDFLMSDSKMGYWYLMSLSVFYVTMLLFNVNKKNNKWLDVIIALFIYSLLFIGWKFGGYVSNILCLLNCTSFFPFFIAGYFIKKYDLTTYVFKFDWLFIIAAVGYVILYNIGTNVHAINSVISRFCVPFCAIFVIVSLFLKREKNGSVCERALSYIGKNTLYVYVFHYFIVNNLHLEAFDGWLISTNNELLSAIVTFVISIPITYISIFVAQQLNTSDMIRKWVFGESNS